MPIPFLPSKAEVPIDEQQVPFGRVHDNELRTTRFPSVQLQWDILSLPERPPRQNQVSIAACPVLDVHLKASLTHRELLGKQLRLIVIPGAAGAERDFLQANEVRILRFDHLPDSIQLIPAVNPTDTLVNVVTDESHGTNFRL